MPQVTIVDNDAPTRALLTLLLNQGEIDAQDMDASEASVLFLSTCPNVLVVMLFDNAYPKFSTEFLFNALLTNPRLQRHSYCLLSTFAPDSDHPYHDLSQPLMRMTFFSPFNFPDIVTCVREEILRLQRTS